MITVLPKSLCAAARSARSPRYSSREVRLDPLEERARARDHHRALRLPRRRRPHEDGAVQVVEPFGLQPLRARVGEVGPRRGVVQKDGAGGEAGSRGRDHLLDHGVVAQDEVDSGGAANGFRGARGGLHAEAREGLRLRRGAVPGGDGVAAGCRGLGEGGAEEPGAEEGEVCHWGGP
jgi:hypothetical protein